MKILKSKNTEIKKFTTLEVILLVIISLVTGFFIGNIIKGKNTLTSNTYIKDEYLRKFVTNYEYIINNYYEEVDKEKLISGAIEGMTESLGDPYSTYFDENESDNFSITLEGSYQGIGVQIVQNPETGNMIVTYVFDNSPASEAGLKIGDEIISANSKKAKDMTTSEFSSYIRKDSNKEVRMKVLRDGNNIDVLVNKNIVTIDSVTSKTMKVTNKKVGYIYIGIFANNTYAQFKEALSKLEKEKIDYLIVDVRGNTGGHLSTVDGILDLFLNSKQVMYQIKQGEKIKKTYGTGKDSKSYEIILLGDQDSASASEVLIAGLRENLNCKFFGKKTYGKGTVQELIDVTSELQYKITTKKWLTPKGNWVNDTKGIVPDKEVDMDKKYYQTGKEEDDSQLNAVLEYIKGK